MLTRADIAFMEEPYKVMHMSMHLKQQSNCLKQLCQSFKVDSIGDHERDNYISGIGMILPTRLLAIF